MRRVSAFFGMVAIVLTTLAADCARPAADPPISSSEARPYFMGFSVIPPRPDVKLAVRAMEVWTMRADAAIMHLDVPWAMLLAGQTP